MKTKSSLLFILIAAFFLTSCGAKKTSATFEVSTSALSVSNTSYTGGLVIIGSSKSGSFTIPVGVNGSSGNKITLDLPRDIWTFSAVGWEGAGHFQGNTKCGSLSDVDLNQDEQTVNLAIDYAKCGTDTTTFGSNSYRVSNSYVPLKIITCGWLYEADGVTPVSSSTSLNYCDSGSGIDAKYKNWAKSVKIEIPQIINGVRTAGISRCFASGTDGVFNSPSINTPEKGVPFVITLYSQQSCPNNETIISKFEFNDGIGVTLGDFDSALNPNAGDARLFLPSYDTKRGYSSLLAQKANPLFCNGAPCFSIPTVIPSTKDRIVSSGSEFVVTATPTTNQSCDKLIAPFSSSNITPSPTLANIKADCEMKNGKMMLRLNFTSLVGLATISLNFDGGTGITLNLATDSSYDAHQLAWETVGFPLTPPPVADVRDSFKAFFDHKTDSGLLTEVRDLMGPEGAGGILGAGLGTCSTAAAVNYVTFIEEGISKSYKIELMNADSVIEVSTFQDDGTVTAATPYQKKIVISRQLGPNSFSTEQTLHFNCGYSVGRYYGQHTKPGKTEYKLIEWNTQTATNARVKEIRYEEERSGAQLTRAFSSFRYAEAPDSLNVIVRTYHLDMQWNGTDYTFYPRSSQLAVKNSIPGFTYVDANAATSTGALNDTTYVTNLVNQIASPTTSLCIDKTTFGAGACSILPVTFDANPINEAFVFAYLLPQAIVNFF